MQLIPVLEIRHGKCVHTEPKNSANDKVIKESVLDKVADWVSKGVERIHVVDVDAIESGEPENVTLLRKLKQEHPNLIIQVLGGVKCLESAYIWIDALVDYIVLNGKAIRQRNLLDDICVEFPNQILVELDTLDGKVAMGAGEPHFGLASIARQLEEDGVAGLVINQIRTNGQSPLVGLESILSISNELEMEIFTHGGIETANDLAPLIASRQKPVSGVLIGKALYNGFCLNEAAKLLAKAS
ncbi:HisA/HisF-related TIM barrel protein [Aliikangiella sp. G2MR2-5]|uniref:HisA/HisF-related TIM barrel protein n=1 Tax=Aliikangiella sp. G2MR2-5 TaxID=2788943 RepID=UPI0018A97F17|nr:HisA/HisF-related TIM barrel protein [Aliikangiella sp. G2MR2-5]